MCKQYLSVNMFLYYFSHTTETTHWDHPEMKELMEALSKYIAPQTI